MDLTILQKAAEDALPPVLIQATYTSRFAVNVRPAMTMLWPELPPAAGVQDLILALRSPPWRWELSSMKARFLRLPASGALMGRRIHLRLTRTIRKIDFGRRR
jgi:hypothetical protein